MKKLILLAALALPVSAEITSEEVEICKGYGELAAVTMKARQAGVPASKLYDYAIKNNNEAIKELVTLAYKVPQFRAPDNKVKAIEQFQNDREMVCFEVMDANDA